MSGIVWACSNRTDIEELPVLDYADLIIRIEKLDIRDVNRSIARAQFIAVEANANRLVRAFDWLNRVCGEWGRNRPSTT